MKVAKIEKNSTNNGWIITIEEDNKVLVTTIVMGTHEEATKVAENFLTEARAEPRFLAE
jgi:hypothetical protein